MQPTEKLELELGSEIPTEPAPEKAELAAREALKTASDQEAWCDSEAPTGVATERPLLPRPPRPPSV